MVGYLRSFLDFCRAGGTDSLSDRLNWRYSVWILVVFCVAVSVHMTDPPSCWCPAQFTAEHVQYANQICLRKTSFHLPIVDDLPTTRSEMQIAYYKWIPLILLSQLVLCAIPKVLWNVLRDVPGLNLTALTDAADAALRPTDPYSRDRNIRFMTKRMANYFRRSNMKGVTFGIFLFVKWLYFINCVGQMLILNTVLGSVHNSGYGVIALQSLRNGTDLVPSKNFPHVFVCDFVIRHMGRVHSYTVQCTLPMNYVYEMMFIFLWFWFLFVTIATSLSFLVWLIVALFRQYHVMYIRHRLQAAFDDHQATDNDIQRFVIDHVGPDGFLVVRLISRNTSDVIASDLVSGLYGQYTDRQRALHGMELTSVGQDKPLYPKLSE